ncbi:hypothetical protein AGMMS49579_25770 [Spirochaetia bacterium]|nr:hypothetical protein AGMMS49579_25770 [Spirochaetia bacterium]
MAKYYLIIIAFSLMIVSCIKNNTHVVTTENQNDEIEIIMEIDNTDKETNTNESTEIDINPSLKLLIETVDAIWETKYIELDEDDYDIMGEYEFERLQDEQYRLRYNAIVEAYLSFFKLPESLSIDFSKEISNIRLERGTSDDGLLNVYNWISNRESNWHCDSLIQYTTESGNLNTILSREITQNEELDIIGFGGIENLAKDIYLLSGHARAAPWVYIRGYITIKLENDTLKPYFAFNNEMSLCFYEYHPNGWKGFEQNRPFFDINWDNNSGNDSSTIRIPYGKSETNIDGILDFVFNGKEFLGDYTKFNEIRN